MVLSDRHIAEALDVNEKSYQWRLERLLLGCVHPGGGDFFPSLRVGSPAKVSLQPLAYRQYGHSHRKIGIALGWFAF